MDPCGLLVTDSNIGMAEQSAHDVVKQQSEGDASLSDDIATKKSVSTSAAGEELVSSTIGENALARTGNESISQTSISVPSQQPVTEGALFTTNPSEERERAINTGTLGQAKPSSDETHSYSRDRSNNVNGAIEDDLQMPVDASVASDSDSANKDAVDPTKKLGDEKGHSRTNSVKKPGAFKAVSVTRTFLQKTAAGSTAGSKLGGDKASTTQTGSSTQATPRPRLVAKSGSSLRDSLPTSSSSGPGGEGVSGADGSKVWNKNRPPQPAAPKQFTDEELKQQYGIHLATRLQTDEGKEAKWADIDDDDDDWAPDTIEWNDGTKITLPHPDEQPISENKTTSRELQAGLGGDSVGSIIQVRDSLPGKPADPKISVPMAGKAGLVLKGAAERQTLVAKPPGPPTPAKSPWAPLPPVNKVPPVTINPIATPQQAARFQQNNPHGFESMPAPAKEIAADDFSRSTWRENHPSTSRELFNSQSGRYEPVAEGRRGSIRQDQHFRQPSVLQRPSPTDQKGPAEPSAAFQTSRSSGYPDAGWGRRRASSNISGGSGSLGQQSSFGKGQDMPPPPQDFQRDKRRDSQAIIDSPSSPRNFSPVRTAHHQNMRGHSPSSSNVHSSHQSWQTRPPVTTNQGTQLHSEDAKDITVSSHSQPTQATSVQPLQQSEYVDPVAMQQKVMREGRELARQRRKEQEEKEEALRKERIAAKLAALPPPPNASGDKPVSESQTAIKTLRTGEAKVPSQAPKSPPKPPVPEIAGEVQQYGMMKLHRPEPVKQRIGGPHGTGHPASGPQPADPRSTTQAKIPLNDLPEASRPKENTPLFSDRSHPVQQEVDTRYKDVNQAQGSTRQDQPWMNVPPGPDKYTSWGASGMTTHSAPGGNLWGPPSNDKALGNGTFDGGFGSRLPPPPTHSQQLTPPGPGPIGPPSVSPRLSSNSTSPQIKGATQINGQEMRTDQRIPPGAHHPHQMNHYGGNVNPRGNSSYMPMQPGPIGPPGGPLGVGRQQHTRTPPGMSQEQHAQAINAWKNFPVQLQRQEAEERDELERKWQAEREEETRTGIKKTVPQTVYEETWRQVKAGDGPPGQRRLVSVVRTVNAPVADLDIKGPHQVQPNGVVSTARGSRFFPNGSEINEHQIPGKQTSLSRPASPPPPDALDHPVRDGNTLHPQVSLPIPKPIVRLPPPISVDLSEPVSRSLPSPERISSATTNNWQDKFNDLLGKKQISPPKSYALAVNSAAMGPMEGLSISNSATVSLPKKHASSAMMPQQDTADVTSKPTEESLLEDRDFGSLPVIKVPKMTAQNLLKFSPAGPPPINRSKPRLQRQFMVTSIESMRFPIHDNSDGYLFRIRLPGVVKHKTVLKPRLPGGSPRHRNMSFQFKDKHKSPKSRETPSSFSSPHPANGPSPRPHGPSSTGSWVNKPRSAAAV